MSLQNVIFIFFALFCLSSCKQSTVNPIEKKTQPTDVLYYFRLNGSSAEIDTSSKVLFLNSTNRKISDQSINNVDRFFDTTTLKIIGQSGWVESVKPLDTLKVDWDGRRVILKRYIYGMGKIDGLNLLGLIEDRFVFVINVTWNEGFIDYGFYISYKNSSFDKNVFKTSLPPPPPPPIN